MSLGDSASITCTASESVSDYVTWYQQKPGQPPKILIYDADNQWSGVPDRFSGIQSGTEFIFKISRVEAEDAATYYCCQSYAVPPTVSQPHAKTLLPEMVQGGHMVSPAALCTVACSEAQGMCGERWQGSRNRAERAIRLLKACLSTTTTTRNPDKQHSTPQPVAGD